MFGNALANLVINIIVNSRGFNAQLGNVQSKLNQTASIANRTRSFFLLTGATYAAGEFIKKLAEIETGFFRIERVAKDFKGTGFRRQVFDLADEISGSPIEDVQKIMKISAQLGIRGRENILEFSRSMTMLANVTGLSADTITTDIGKVIQVFNLLPQDAERVSNSILQVADDFNVVETEITNIVRRIGAFANSIGLTAEETIGFAAAMKDVGVNTEIAASSLYTFFARLQTEPVALGKFFGLDKNELFDFFKTLRQNPIQGIVSLLERIRNMPPSERLAFFEQLELYGVRNAAALGTLAEKVDRLKAALDSANKGSEENIRLLQGQWDRSRTLAGGIDDLSDAWKNFIFELTDTGAVNSFFNFFTDKLTGLKNQLREINGLKISDVDITDEASVRKRILELNKSVGATLKERKEGDLLFLPELSQALLGKQNQVSIFLKDLSQNLAEQATDFGGFQREVKELEFLNKVYKRLTEPEEGPINDPDRPDDAAVRAEFNAILNREEKKGRNRDLFKGFMGLTEAWKNLFLDKNKDSELEKLNDIHDEAVIHNDKLGDLIGAVENIRLGAVLG